METLYPIVILFLLGIFVSLEAWDWLSDLHYRYFGDVEEEEE